MDIEQAIKKFEEYFQSISDIQDLFFTNDLNLQDIKSRISPYINSRDKLLPILFILNEIGFSRPYPLSFFNEMISFLSPQIRQNFTSDEVASIFTKSTRNYIPLFHYGCININTIINRSYLSEGIFKMFHIVIEKQDPIYYQISIQKASPSLKTFIQQKDKKDRETVTAIQNDNYDHVQTVASRKNLSLSSKIPMASTQINDNIKYSWQMPSMLEYAAMQGSLDTFKYLLLNGAEITESLSNFAIRGGNYEIIHILEREKHVCFNEQDLITAVKYNRNDLVDYIVNNYNQKHSLYSLFEAVDDYNIHYFLDHFNLFNDLKNEFNKNPINWIEMWHQKRALIHIAAKNGFIDLVNLILSINGVDINLKSALDGYSPLHEAASSGFLNVVKLLVDKGANINQVSFHDETPLHVACKKGHFDIVKFLVEKEKSQNINKHAFNMKDCNGDTPLHLAAKNGFASIVEYLLSIENLTVVNDNNKNNSTPLSIAINNCRFGVVEVLCKCEKVDVNLKEQNNPPLLLAVIQNVLPIVKVILSEAADRIDINQSNLFNTNPLQQALKSGYNNIALFLLDCPKIDVSVKNNDNRQVLSYAAETGNIEIVKKVLEMLKKPGKTQNNNEINNDNENNNNAENVECNCNDDNDKNDISNNDDESMNNVENKSGNIDMDVAFNINDVDFFGQTALHLAAKNGHFEIMQLLINAGIDIHRKNSIFNFIFF